MMYCKTCDSPICNACSLSIPHCDHEQQDIEDFVQAQRQQLRAHISDVEVRHALIQQHSDATRRDAQQLIGTFVAVS